MKHLDVLFIVGSVEPGKNGVGDYTRCLAAELSQIGYETIVLATHDKCVQQETDDLQSVGTVQVRTLRYPASGNNVKRLKYIQDVLGKYRVDCVSLQFVPYSFHPKGVPLFFMHQLNTLLSGSQVHIMFHECWVGMLSPVTWKLRLLGPIQRYLVQMITKKPHVRLITTSNEFYQAHLRDIGVSSRLLPLFSNIGYSSPAPVLSQVTQSGRALSEKDLNKTYLIAGIFGSIYPFIDLQQALEQLLQRALNTDRKLIILTFGRAAEDGLQKLQSLVDASDQQVEHMRLGELPESEVSTVMQKLEVAVSCTPKPLIGKSGVFAAMKLHDIEVLTYGETSAARKFKNLIDGANVRLSERPPNHWGVKWVAQTFVQQLIEVKIINPQPN